LHPYAVWNLAGAHACHERFEEQVLSSLLETLPPASLLEHAVATSALWNMSLAACWKCRDYRHVFLSRSHCSYLNYRADSKQNKSVNDCDKVPSPAGFSYKDRIVQGKLQTKQEICFKVFQLSFFLCSCRVKRSLVRR
jgi:hypothetical protein